MSWNRSYYTGVLVSMKNAISVSRRSLSKEVFIRRRRLLVVLCLFALAVFLPLSVFAIQNIFVQADKVVDIQVGDTPVDYVYVGNTLVWERQKEAGCSDYTVANAGYYEVELWGAQGGGLGSKGYEENHGGLGGYTRGIIYFDEGDNYTVCTGGLGNDSHTIEAVNRAWKGGEASFNGGANGGNGYNTWWSGGGGGGGATDLRLVNGATWDDPVALKSRIMVAGGGGGRSVATTDYSAVGGGLVGENGVRSTGHIYPGGSQNGGGGFGVGTGGYRGYGAGTTSNNSDGTGGGGGGYYGGVGKFSTTRNNSVASGGGGSSFISGYAGVNAIESDEILTHTGNTLHYSGKYFLNGYTEPGVNEGIGRASIRYIGTKLEKKTDRLDGVRYVEDCINGSSTDTSNRWIELQAMKNGVNVAKGKNISGTSVQNNTYTYSFIVDGDITGGGEGSPNISNVTSKYGLASETGLQCISVDLQDEYDLDEVAVWHYWLDGRTYNDNTLRVSGDGISWIDIPITVGPETSQGNRFSAWE